MRVLWFSNTPSLSAKFSGDITVGGSWIESLEYELMTSSDIELGIVFQELSKESQEIRSDSTDTKYIMVPRHPHRKFDRWISRFFVRPNSQRSLKEYLRIVASFKPDVILFFGTESDFPLIIPELKIPSIIWFQGNLTVYNRMYESGIKVRKAFYKESLKNILWGNSVLHQYLNFQGLVEREKKIFSIAHNFIGRTDWDRRLVSIMAPQANYYHCDEPMRRSFAEKKWIQWQNRDKLVIITTIRENIYKGLEMVYETSCILSQRLNMSLEWRVIGIREYTTYAKAARQKANCSKKLSPVTLLGFKSGSELAQELLNADFYVHPSHIENSPNGVQEAMLLGMPVIATNVGGTPSLLKDGEEGILVQSGDPYALAGAILELYESPHKAKKMGEKARILGLKRNDGKKICSDLLAIFDKLILDTHNSADH